MGIPDYTVPVLPLLACAGVVSYILNLKIPQYGFGLFSTAAAVFFTIQTIWFLYRVCIYPEFVSPLRNLPTAPGANWLTGHAHILFAHSAGIPQRNWNNSISNDGFIRYKFWLNFERVYLTQPKTLSEMLVHKNYEFTKPSFAKAALGPVLGNGILFAEGHDHKVQSKALMPAFSYRHVKELYPVFWDKARVMVDAVSQDIRKTDKSKGKPQDAVEMQDWASRATLDIIGSAGTGHEFNSLTDPENELAKAYSEILYTDPTTTALNLLGQWIPSSLIQLLPFKRNKSIAAKRPFIKQTCQDLIDKKRANLSKGVQDLDILSAAFASNAFTDDQLAEQMITMLTAGHETTAGALTWAAYTLCRRPDMQARLRAEIHANLPSMRDPSSTISDKDIDDLPYLHAVTQEVLRYYPPIAMTMRVAVRDVTLHNQFFPKGTYFVFAPNVINHSQALWGDDATVFDETRWLKPGQANKGGAESNFSFMSFLHGPRSCIGQSFARGEFKVLLAAWVGRFECSFVDEKYEPGIASSVSSKPVNKLWMHVKEVEGGW